LSVKAAGLFVAARSTHAHLFVKNSTTGWWESTGGHIERGETAMMAAIREFWEETGYQGSLTIEDHNYQVGEFLLFDGWIPVEFSPVLSVEHRAYAWRHLDHPPRLLHPGLEAVIREKGYAV